MKPNNNEALPEDPDLEDMPAEWSEEDREIADRKPNLGELDDDPDEIQ